MESRGVPSYPLPSANIHPENTKGKRQVYLKVSVVPAELVLLRIYKASLLPWSFCVDKASFNQKQNKTSKKNPQQTNTTTPPNKQTNNPHTHTTQCTEVTTIILQHSYFFQRGKIKQQYHTKAQGQGTKRAEQK